MESSGGEFAETLECVDQFTFGEWRSNEMHTLWQIDHVPTECSNDLKIFAKRNVVTIRFNIISTLAITNKVYPFHPYKQTHIPYGFKYASTS